MIPAAALAFWGIVVHRICDWLLQSDWMAKNKAERGWYRLRAKPAKWIWPPVPASAVSTPISPWWWSLHPAAFVHSGIHLVGLLVLATLTPWTWWAALAVAAIHLAIDTRTPVRLWAQLMRQTEPTPRNSGLLDVGGFVRFQVDQVFHEVVLCLFAIFLVIT